MASVMRAMSASIGVGSGHRPSLSQDGYLSPDDLSRTTTRPAPPMPASTVGSPTGILLNASRPYNNSSAASSMASVTLPRNSSSNELQQVVSTSSATTSAPSPPQSPEASLSDVDRGRSKSRDSVSKSSNRKIRFAPLPEIRQRSYSTGRNVWLETDGALEDGVRSRTNPDDRRPLVLRRDGEDYGVYDDAVADESSSEDDDSATRTSIFGSWKDSSSGRKSEKEKENEGSYTTKLLRPLSFGLGKKKSKTGRPSTADGSDLLSRVESTESDVSRGSSEFSRVSMSVQGRPAGGGTGIPMRKTRTWELGEVGSPGRRAHYPPVAQRSRSRGGRTSTTATMSISAPDPSFVEWGFAGGSGQGSVAKPRAADDDEDGSGMAWVKRRRAEKEAAEKQKQEDEEAAAAAASSTLDSDDQPGSGAATPVPPAVLLTEAPLPHEAPRSRPLIGGLSATRPGLQVATSPAEGASVTKTDSDSLSSSSGPASSLSSPITDEAVDPSGATLAPIPVRRATTSDASSSADDDDEEEDEDDNDEENEGAESEDSDLDEAELEEEEALAAKARATAISAGAERYHTASHQSRMLKVEGK